MLNNAKGIILLVTYLRKEYALNHEEKYALFWTGIDENGLTLTRSDIQTLK